MLFTYQSTSPCLCTQSNPSDPSSPDTEDCIQVCTITLPSTDDLAVGPCQEMNQIDLADASIPHDFTACGADPVVWSLVSYDTDVFDLVTVSTAGLLDYTTGDVDTAGEHGVVIVRVTCGAFGAYTTVIIGVKDLCSNVSCLANEYCDGCTGDCEPIVDLEID